MLAKLSNIMAKVAELKTSLNSSAARAPCSEGELTSIKTTRAEKARDATSCTAADQAV